MVRSAVRFPLALLIAAHLFAQFTPPGLPFGGAGGGYARPPSINTCSRTYTHTQGKAGSSPSGPNLSVALTSTPMTGDVVVVGIATFNNGLPLAPSVSVSDANGNAYVVTAGSPVGGTSYNGFIFIAYLLSAPANASKTVNLVFSSSTGGFAAAFADEFKPSCGTATLDSGPPGSTGSSNLANSPTIPVSGTSDLLYGVVTTLNTTGAGVGGSWVNVGTVVSVSWTAAYQLSASTGTPVAFQFGTTIPWAAIGASFK